MEKPAALSSEAKQGWHGCHVGGLKIRLRMDIRKGMVLGSE